MNTIDKSQADWHIQAVALWQKTNANLKLFSEACYNVNNKEALAEDCKCNVRTIQYYAAAWSLYQELIREYGNETVSLMWERGEIALWRKAPQLRSTLNLSLEKTYEYLGGAIEHDMTREQMAAHVDGKENKTPQWIRRLKSAIRFLTPSRNDYKSEMPPQLQSRYDKAVSDFVAELEAIAQAEIEEEVQ